MLRFLEYLPELFVRDFRAGIIRIPVYAAITDIPDAPQILTVHRRIGHPRIGPADPIKAVGDPSAQRIQTCLFGIPVNLRASLFCRPFVFPPDIPLPYPLVPACGQHPHIGIVIAVEREFLRHEGFKTVQRLLRVVRKAYLPFGQILHNNGINGGECLVVPDSPLLPDVIGGFHHLPLPRPFRPETARRPVRGGRFTACFCPFGTILSACAEQNKTGENDGSYIGVFHCLAN